MENFKAPSESESKLHFLDYWRVIRIRKTVILAVFLLVALTTTIVTYALPEYYKSTSRIRVEKNHPDINPLLGQQRGGNFDPYFIQTEFETLQSKSVLDRVITNLSLNTDWASKLKGRNRLDTIRTRKMLKGNLQVQQYRNTSMIEISYYSQDKQEAAEVAQEIAEVYKRSRIRKETNRMYEAVQALRVQMDKQEQQVRTQQQKVNRLREKLNISDSVASGSALAKTIEPEYVRQLQQRLVQAQNDLVKWRAVYENFQKMNTNELRNAIQVSYLRDQLLVNLLDRLHQFEQQKTKLLQEVTPKHPEIKQVNQMIDTLNKQINDRVSGLMKGLKARVASAQSEYQEFKNAIEEAKQQDVQAAKTNRPYIAAKRKLENELSIQDVLSKKIAMETIDLQIPRSSFVEITDYAEAGLAPVRPNIPLNIALGCIVGLVVGVGLAFFIEYLDTSVKTLDDVERAMQAPVLGVIPQNVGSLLEEGADSPHAEAYRVLRTNLLFSRKSEDQNTLTVVSSGAGEGKSTTLFNLAIVFAQADQRVLMVDSDLRRPALHKYLKISNSLGLTNFLLRQNALEEVIQTSSQPNLDIMPSGRLPSSSMGILNSNQMKELVQEVKKRYDFVLFDSPPIMGVSDASILASLVDMSVQVIQYRKYPQAMTIRGKQMVQKVGGNLVGVLLNNINMSQDSDYYYYSGYYYDYYYRQEEQDEDEETVGRNDGKKGSSGSDDSSSSRMNFKKKY